MSEPSRQNADAGRKKKATARATRRDKPTTAPPEDTMASLRRANAELRRELAQYRAQRDEALQHEREALDQQTAAAEVLGVINSSPGNLEPVFDAMLEKAMRLCEANFGSLQTFDGERFHFAASLGDPYFDDWFRQLGSVYPVRGTTTGRIARGERVVQIADIADDEGYQADDLTVPTPTESVGPNKRGRPASTTTSRDVRRGLVEIAGYHAMLSIALRKDESLLGALHLYRKEVRPFTEKQIALLQNFAAQAVIAMENARLITETREALEQQTATAEVLQVINASPGDLVPVFEAMLEKAMRLCEAAFGVLWTYEGDRYRAAAVRGAPAAFVEFLREPLLPHYHPGTGLERALRGENLVINEDMSAEGAYGHGDPMRRAIVDLGGARSHILVALRRDETLLGAITIYRQEMRPFSDKQIALLQNFAAQAVIAMENARLITETREALEQQTATTEVLQVINSSPGDLAPVFDAMLERARGLCGAAFGTFMMRDGERFYAVAVHGEVPAPFAAIVRNGFVPGPNSPIGRLRAGEEVVHVPDLAAILPFVGDDPVPRAAVELGGIHTLLMVPLIKDGQLIGVFSNFRQEVQPFSEKQIALLQNFAAQAVIAMENARLVTETREALDQQTATSDVLKVINSSPGNLAPVFDTMLEKAMRLCEAAHGAIYDFDGEIAHPLAIQGASDYVDFVQERGAFRPIAGTPLPEALIGNKVVHIADVRTLDAYRRRTQFQALAKRGGIRTTLIVPLQKDEAVLGVIAVFRQEVRPFTDKQIALLQNFAAQAVIAMENARLVTETREALEQQTATAEVLGVINSSPGDLAPVFSTMLEKATALCEAAFGIMQAYDRERFCTVALHGVPEPLAEFLTHDPPQPSAGSSLARIAEGETLVHVADLADRGQLGGGDARRQNLVRLGGARTYAVVALRKDGKLLGTIAVYRQEVRPFTDKQIALLQNFAAQAVIAMENARLITETREALEQQTATAEVLGVINASPGDLTPVFNAILEKAHTLCDAAHGSLTLAEGQHFRAVALRGMPEEFAAVLRQPFHPGRLVEELSTDAAFVQIPDIAAGGRSEDDAVGRAAAGPGGVRTLLAVPLRKDGALLGYITANRREVRPFTDKQITLLQNFAAQAVIAMENARLINETREALEQQTATAEVLQVINSSPGDLAPVFEAMLEKATRLCDAPFGQLALYDGEMFHFVAAHGEERFALNLRRDAHPPSDGITWLRILGGEDVVHVSDARETDLYRSGHLRTKEFVENGGGRALLSVALRKDDALLGILSIYRQEPLSFSDKQIALLQNFAAQAVIAMENARLITETREALEQQTATAEVLWVINSSPGDLAPVFDAMLGKATRLCEAGFGNLWLYDGERFSVAAVHAVPPEFAEFARKPLPVEASASLAELVRGSSAVHVPDLAATELYQIGNPIRRAIVDLGGARTLLSVALRKDNALLGAFNIYRQEVRPFSDKQIALVQNFAAQAVIAIENARLISETREALEQQTATAEVLGVINSSPGNLGPVFEVMLERATQLCDAVFGVLLIYDGEHFEVVAARNPPEAYAEFAKPGKAISFGPGTAPTRLLAGEQFVHIIDGRTEPAYRQGAPAERALIELAGARTWVTVPLRKDDHLLGAITVFRQEVRPFTDKQVALLQNFAAQAVIAMENARLVSETKEALDQQTATAEVLGVINSSPGDLAPVFDAMLDKAMRLCEATYGHLVTFDGEFIHIAALTGDPRLVDHFRHIGPVRPPSESVVERMLRGEDVVHIQDTVADAGSRVSGSLLQALADIGGTRSLLGVALRKDGILVGGIVVYRQEVRPFTDKQIALLQNFAAQAVIAMENARLLTETREALEQQTATAEVLGVINSSPGNLAPVFDVMVERAANLCEADEAAVRSFDGELLHLITTHGTDPTALERLRGLGPTSLTGLYEPFARGDEVVHYVDARDTDAYRTHQLGRQRIDARGIRSWLAVALRKEGVLLGIINVHRREVRPFSEKEIALLQNFAAQAVIAMENARLLTETRERTAELQEALEYQTATSDVLQVISRSTFDLQRVLQTLAESAAALVQSDTVFIFRREGDVVRLVAQHAPTPAYGAVIGSLTLGADHRSTTGRALMTGEAVRITDVQKEPDYQLPQSVTDNVGSTMAVPLLRDGETIGVITLARLRVEPYTDRQVELVRTFADQAVIAIENTRLLDEIQQRQAELRVTFDNMADGVAMFDHELRLTAWNRNFQQLLDLPDGFLAERPGFDAYIRYLTERGEFGDSEPESEIARLRDRLGDHYGFERTRPDGTVIEVRNNPMPDGGVVVIYSDITERKRSEEEIRAARDAAEAAYADLKAAQANLVQAQKMAALGQLTAGIAHEIKNPLNFVNNFASLSVELLDELKETAAPALATLDEDKRADVDDTMELLTGNLEKIAEHGKRADNIVKSMLEHSRGVSGERREVDLNGVIEEALNLAYHGARAQDQSFNITLERDYAPSLAPIELAPQEMTRVFLNLIGNGFYAATKRARDNGDASFRPVLTVQTREDGNVVEVRVRDNGTGIPAEIRDKLFQPFFTTKPTGEGTGLGLSISYDIVTQQHGGTITVESEPGAYTEFTVRLPRQ